MKWALKGHHYAAIQMAVTKQLYNIPESAFQDCFKDLQKHWKQYIDTGGSYFKGDP